MKFKKREIIKNIAWTGTALFLLLASFFIGPGNSQGASSLIINEIMYSLPGADDKHEWIELFNAGSSEIDLTGWKFHDGDDAINHALNAPPKNGSRGSLILPAGGFLLLAGDAATVAADLPGFSEAIIDTVMSLVNSSATLKIINKDGQEVCSAFYSKEIGADGNGKTLEWDGAQLKESFAEGGTPGAPNSVLSPNYSPAPTATPSPTATGSAETVTPTPSISPTTSPAPAYQYSKDIFINEFFPYPPTGEKEWMELFNADEEIIDLNGWGISDQTNIAHPQIIPADTKIEPNSFLVVELEKQILNNDGDQLSLLWPDGQVLHAVSYQKATAGQSVSRLDSGQWIWTNRPTPGAKNLPSLFAATASKNETAPPAITTLQETASQPTPAKSPAAANLTKATETQAPTASPEAENIITKNTLAAASQSQLKNAGPKTIFILLGVLFFSALAAAGLIFFRRKTQADSKKSDDSVI